MKRAAIFLTLPVAALWGYGHLLQQPQAVAEPPDPESALSTAPRVQDSTVVRRVWSGAGVVPALFPDGGSFSYTDWETGDLAVVDLATGETRRITNKGAWSDSDEYALGAAVSLDGNRIAYAWSNPEFVFELRTIATDGSQPRVVYRNEEVEYLRPFDWSPDGRYILTTLSLKNRTNQIALVSVDDGSLRVLKTVDWRSPDKMGFSPDGRFIVYDFPPAEDNPQRDIFVLAVDGSREFRLVEDSADDLLLGWAPDGDHVLFASDRTGTMSAFLIAVRDGRPQGPPKLVKSDMWRLFPIGFARKGSYFYGVAVGERYVYAARLDVTTGELLASPVKISERFVGTNFDLEWSPDGRYLAYGTRRGLVPRGPASKTLTIRSVESGEERTLSPKLNYFFRLRWSPDGRLILVSGSDMKNRRGIYTIDVQTGGVWPILRTEPGTYAQWPVWSADGNAVFYQLGGQRTGLFVHEIETGSESEIYSGSTGNDLVLSPDGSQLAFFALDQEPRVGRLVVMSANGGQVREVLRLEEGQDGWPITWTDDRLVYMLRFHGDTNTRRPDELWSVSLEDGAARKLDFNEPMGPGGVRFHPDGQTVAFVKGRSQIEVWVMEHFLPNDSNPPHR